MVLYNIIRLTLVTSLIIYLISPDVERRLSFALAFTAAFFLPASVSIPTTYHGDWQIAAVSELSVSCSSWQSAISSPDGECIIS